MNCASWRKFPRVSSNTATIARPLGVGGWVEKTPRSRDRSPHGYIVSVMGKVFDVIPTDAGSIERLRGL